MIIIVDMLMMMIVVFVEVDKGVFPTSVPSLVVFLPSIFVSMPISISDNVLVATLTLAMVVMVPIMKLEGTLPSFVAAPSIVKVQAGGGEMTEGRGG